MAETNIGAGGEEWRRMDKTAGYNPDEFSTTINEARANITKIRQRDVELRVLGRDGKPLADLPVEVVQTDSDFLWGDQLWGLDRRVRNGTQHQDDCKAYRRLLPEILNACAALMYWTERPRNDGPKSEEWQGYPQYDALQWCVDWGNSAGLTVKGHPLFWSIPKAVPEWVKKYDYETQMKFVEVRIRSITSRFRGKIKLYDAVNEPMWEPAFKNLPQRDWPHLEDIGAIADYIEPVLRWARDEDPDADYLVNEYGLLAGDHEGKGVTTSDGQKVTGDSQLKRFIQLLHELLDRGAAPDVVGLQSHTAGWGHHDKQVATYDAIGEATNLPVHVTEFWAHTKHLQDTGMSQDEIDHAQAEYVKNYVTCAFGNENVESFFFWGMSGDLIRFRKNGGWETTIVFDEMKDLLRNQWRTRESLKTDGDGVVRFRGFRGEYSLRFRQSDNHPTGVKFDVRRGPGTLMETVELPYRPRA
ncbi:MAG: endo-1,4-beta-xylanase [Phycisphaerae bacterium]